MRARRPTRSRPTRRRATGFDRVADIECPPSDREAALVSQIGIEFHGSIEDLSGVFRPPLHERDDTKVIENEGPVRTIIGGIVRQSLIDAPRFVQVLNCTGKPAL